MSLRGLGGILGEKWLVLAQNCADLKAHLPIRHPYPRPPTVSLRLKLWIWKAQMSMQKDGLRRVEPEALGGTKVHNRKK